MKLKVKGLRAKQTAAGIRFYWEPNGPERKAGWTAKPLGADLAAAVTAAERRNAEIEEWRAGGGKPLQVKRFVKSRTVAAGIARYKEEVLAKQSDNTRRTAATPLRRIEEWCGDMPISWVGRAEMRAWRDGLLRACKAAGHSHHPAFHALERARILWQWFIDQELATTNPFVKPGLGKPPPRQAYWEDRHVAAITAAARAEDEPMVALAIELGLYCGQREADILAMPISAWREIPRSKFRADPGIWQTLVDDATTGPDAGKVMGIYVRQGKTKRWVGIPVEGEARRRIEAAIADAKAKERLTILGRDRDGKPWQQDNFIDRFGKIRAAAANLARKEGNADLAHELEALWFGDLRRSCVVYLGELGLDDAAIGAITGHQLTTIKTILETYMPRTEGMAARAITARRDARGESNVTSIDQGRKEG